MLASAHYTRSVLRRLAIAAAGLVGAAGLAAGFTLTPSYGGPAIPKGPVSMTALEVEGQRAHERLTSEPYVWVSVVRSEADETRTMLVDNRRDAMFFAVNDEPWLLQVGGRMWRWQERGCWELSADEPVTLAFVQMAVQRAVGVWAPPVASEADDGSKTLIWDLGEDTTEGTEPRSIVLRDGLIVATHTHDVHATFRYPSSMRRIAAPAADEVCEGAR